MTVFVIRKFTDVGGEDVEEEIAIAENMESAIYIMNQDIIECYDDYKFTFDGSSRDILTRIYCEENHVSYEITQKKVFKLD